MKVLLCAFLHSPVIGSLSESTFLWSPVYDYPHLRHYIGWVHESVDFKTYDESSDGTYVCKTFQFPACLGAKLLLN
jgi:hypothetical protein